MKKNENSMDFNRQVLGRQLLSTWKKTFKCLKLKFQVLETVRTVQLTAVAAVVLVMAGCTKEDFQATSKYSTRYRVICGFNVASYKELLPAVGGAGTTFATIRQAGGELHMECENLVSDPNYKMDALQKDFQFGCGGLILGNDYSGTLCCFDLACPNCDQAQFRLTVKDAQATCKHCGIVYALENDTYILDKGNGMHPDPRGLYQYRAIYNGIMVQMSN